MPVNGMHADAGAIERKHFELQDELHDEPGRFEAARPRKPLIEATPYVYRPPSEIPPRRWIYGRLMIRGFITLLVAAGATYKSTLVLIEAIALVTGRNLLGVPVREICKVWYWCGEDPLEEIERRVGAILLFFRIDPSEVEGRLFLNSGRNSKIIIVETTPSGTKLAVPLLDDLSATIKKNEIDVVILDPLISTHRVSENDNGAIDMLAKSLNQLAEEQSCAVYLVHHVRKSMNAPGTTTVEDGRGAGSLLAAARIARVMNHMTEVEATKARVEDRYRYVRADNGKSNMAPCGSSTWFKVHSVSLNNGSGDPCWSDELPVLASWAWPDAMESITTADLAEVRRKVDVADPPYRSSPRSTDGVWVGELVAEVCRLDINNKSDLYKINFALTAWFKSGALVILDRDWRDPKTRKYRPIVRAGVFKE